MEPFGALDEMPQGRMGLSAPVFAAVDVAVTVIESLVWKILAESAGDPHLQPQAQPKAFAAAVENSERMGERK
jgi:hypothetical protein